MFFPPEGAERSVYIASIPFCLTVDLSVSSVLQFCLIPLSEHIQTERSQWRFSDRLFLNIYADEEQSAECVICASLYLCVNACLAACPHSNTPLSMQTHQ